MFPGRIPGACMLMSAAYSMLLEKLELARGYVVAGSLYVSETRIFGEDEPFDGGERFSQSNLSMDVHAWVLFGDRLVDASIFRTADSKSSHPALREYVQREFGTGRGFMISKMGSLPAGLRYEPQYVLTQDQVDALFLGGRKLITGK